MATKPDIANLISWYDFIADANDDHAANDLTNVGATFSANGALLEKANSDHLYIADNADFSFVNEDFTLLGMFYKNALIGAGDDFGLCCKFDYDSNEREYRVYIDEDETIRFSVTNSGSSAGTELTGFSTLISTWYMVMAVHDSVNNLLKISAQRVGIARTDYSTAYSLGCRDGLSRLIFGAWGDPDGAYADAYLRYWSLWSAALSTDNFDYFWNSGNGLSYAQYIGLAGIKTINGIALTNIKTMNGLAVASIKSINGIT